MAGLSIWVITFFGTLLFIAPIFTSIRAAASSAAAQNAEEMPVTNKYMGVDLKVTGIMGSADRCAIVNNSIVKVGDVVRSAKVLNIDSRSVKFARYNSTFTVWMQ